MYAQELPIFAFGCVHFGCDTHDEDLWIEFLKRIERTPSAVVFGLGDYTDAFRAHNRAFLKQWGEEDQMHDTLDDLFDDQLLKPLTRQIQRHCPSFSEKCVAMVEGNHHYKYFSGGRAGQTSTQELCRILNVPYGGLAAWRLGSV